MAFSVDGLASGLDTSSIIRSLIAISQRPIQQLKDKSSRILQQQTAMGGIQGQLSSLRQIALDLTTLATYRTRKAASSSEAVLSARASSSAAIGAFTFRVGRTASASQAMSKGFSDSDTSAVGAGTFSLELGTRSTSPLVDPRTALSFLNGQTGVARGSVKVTDRAGNAAIVDLSTAENVQDVLDAVNANGTAKVSAAASGDAIVITDQSGSTSSNLKVEEVGGRNVARDLGILKSVASSTLTGDAVNFLSTTARLDALNNGLGVRNASGTDFTLTIDGGAPINVSLASTATTLADVISAIQTAASGAGESVTVSLKSGRKGLQIVDNAGDGGSILVTDVSGAAADLGLTGTTASDTHTGRDVIPELNTILTKTVQGGSGITTAAGADFRVTLSNGSTFDVDLDSTTHVNLQDIVDAIKAAHDAAYPATASSFSVEVNGAGNGLRLKDFYGGTGNLTVAALNGSTAGTSLGLIKTGSGGTLEGDDIDRQFISSAMRLADLNGGKGIFKGKFQVTDRQGKIFTVDASVSTVVTVADLISAFSTAASAAGSSATLAVNSAGDGLILTSSTGSGQIKVSDLEGGTAAKDLNLATTGVSASTVDGTNEISVSVASSDTLEDVAQKINDLGRPVVASIIHDGSASAPYRLVVTSRETGEAGGISIDRKTTSLELSTSIRSRNASVLVGDTSAGSNPLLVVSPDNTVENVLTGLTIDLKSASSSPVTVTVSNDDDALSTKIAELVGSFNAAVAEIREQSKYDAETGKGGPLLGNPTVRAVEDRLFAKLRETVAGLNAPLDRLQAIGISVNKDGLLVFDKDKLGSRLQSDRTGVEKLLRLGAGITASTPLSKLRSGEGVRSAVGYDFQISTRSGQTFKVNLDNAETIQAVLTAINTASGNPGVTATVSSDGSGITLTDATSGTANLVVTNLNSSHAADDLGISGTETTSSGSSSTVKKGDTLLVNGLMASFARDLDLLTRSEDGVLTRADGAFQDQIDETRKQIESLQARVDKETERLQRQFAELEKILSASQQTATFLSQQFAALSSAQARQGSGGGLKLF